MKKRVYDQYVAENPHVVNEIVEADLCVRCGACEPACPFDIIRFDDQALPYITNEDECRHNCVRCLKVCPGGDIDLTKLDQDLFGKHPHPDSITGITNGSFVSYSTDDDVRAKGASGGFVTAFLQYLMEHDVIDGVLVMGTTVDETGWQQKPFIARTIEELKRSAKSKYLVAPMLAPLGEMEKLEGRYAVVALPCYVHAIKKYQRVSPKLRKRLKFIIGLYCNVALEPDAISDLCELKGAKRTQLTDLQFRGGEWPGAVRASVDHGPEFKVLKNEEMKDEFNTLKLFYTPKRCDMCVDFSAEHADIAVGDPWLRAPDGSYLYPDGYTTLLTRTDLGRELVLDAQEQGYIKLEDLPLETFMMNFETSARYKRKLVPAYIEVRRRMGQRVPKYNRQIGEKDFTSQNIWQLRNGLKAVFLHAMSNYKWWRKTSIRVLQSRPAILYFRWNRGRKARKYATTYSKGTELADRFIDYSKDA